MQFLNAIHPERQIDGFSRSNGTITFYTFVRAAVLRTNARKILDYGAGRGEWFYHTGGEESLLRKHLRDLRVNGAHVTACDIDPVVLTHPASDAQVRIHPDQPLPFDDETFDVIVSDWTFEHLEQPELVARELTRVLKPGGYLCVRTPHATGYIRLFAQLIPNRLHTTVLKRAQPTRKEEDVFPTVYRINSARALRKHFPDCDLYCIYDTGDPAYYFGNSLVYRATAMTHRLLPKYLAPLIYAFLKKQ